MFPGQSFVLSPGTRTFPFVFSFLHPGKTFGTISVRPSIFFGDFALIWCFLSLFYI